MEEMETMMYKSCIFDLDGTLTDTLDSLTFSVNLTMKEMGPVSYTHLIEFYCSYIFMMGCIK